MFSSADRTPDRVPDRTGAVVLRVWLEPGVGAPLRARIVVLDDARNGETTWATASGAEAVLAAVSHWLETWAAAQEPGDAGRDAPVTGAEQSRDVQDIAL